MGLNFRGFGYNTKRVRDRMYPESEKQQSAIGFLFDFLTHTGT